MQLQFFCRGGWAGWGRWGVGVLSAAIKVPWKGFICVSLPFFFLSFLKICSPSSIPVAVRTLGSCSRGHCHANQLDFKRFRCKWKPLSPPGVFLLRVSATYLCFPPLPSSRLLNLKLPFSPLPTYGTCAAAAATAPSPSSSSSYIPGVEALYAEAINIGCTYGDRARQMAPGEAQSLPTRFLYIKLAWHKMKNITCHWGT